jgi:hypothetical protein
MAGGQTPMNQLDALPIITAAQWVSVVVSAPTQQGMIGGKLLKYWNAAALGVNGAAGDVHDSRTGAVHQLLTNYIDLTGLDSILLVLNARCTAGGVDNDQVWHVYALPYGETSLGAVNHQPFPPGPDNRNMTGVYAGGVGGIAIGAFPKCGQLVMPDLVAHAADDVKQGAIAFAVGVPVAGWGTCAPCCVCRFLLNATDDNPNWVMYLQVWGQG